MLNCFAMTGAFTIFNITRDDLAIFIVLIDSLTMSLSSAMLTPAWDKLFLSHADSVFKRFSWRFFRATFLSLLLTVSAPSSFLIKVCGRFKSPPPPPSLFYRQPHLHMVTGVVFLLLFVLVCIVHFLVVILILFDGFANFLLVFFDLLKLHTPYSTIFIYLFIFWSNSLL